MQVRHECEGHSLYKRILSVIERGIKFSLLYGKLFQRLLNVKIDFNLAKYYTVKLIKLKTTIKIKISFHTFVL